MLGLRARSLSGMHRAFVRLRSAIPSRRHSTVVLKAVLWLAVALAGSSVGYRLMGFPCSLAESNLTGKQALQNYQASFHHFDLLT